MAQAVIDQEKLRSNQYKFCSNPCIEETSCISRNPTDDEKWAIGNNVKNSKNDGGNKKENGKKISTKTKKSKLSKSKSTESYYYNGCFYDDIKAILDEIEVQSGKIDQTKEDQEESHKKLSESIDVIVFEKELNENNDVNDKKICKGINEKEDFEGDLDDNDSFIATCHPCGINFYDNDEDSVNKRFREHEKICKVKNEKEDVEGDLDDNDNDNNYQEEEEEDNDFFFIIHELLIDEIKNDSSMPLKEKSKLLKPLEKICKDNNEKEDVEGDLDDNDKKIKKMQMKNQNCKSPPPPPPPTPTKGPSNFLKPHRPTKNMKAVVKIRKLLPPLPPSRKKLFYPSPTKGSFNLLKPHREQYYKLKEMIEKIKLFSDKEKSNKEENEVINHQRVEVSIHIQSKSRQAEFESEDIVPPNIETSPCEEVGNRPLFPRTLSIFHKSMRCKKGIKRKFNLDEENLEYPKKKKMTKTENLELIINELDKKKMKMKINKMRNFLKFNIDEDVSQPNVHQIIPPASNNFSVDLHLKFIRNKLRKNRKFIPSNIETPPEGMDNTQLLPPVDEVVIQSNAPQTEPEKEDIIPSNIETLLPEVVDNTQQFSTRPSSPVDSKDLFFFHKSMLRKQGTKRKFNLDEDDNEENVEPPKKMMRMGMKIMCNSMGMKIMWNSGTIHWGRLGRHRSQRRDIIIKKF